MQAWLERASVGIEALMANMSRLGHLTHCAPNEPMANRLQLCGCSGNETIHNPTQRSWLRL